MIIFSYAGKLVDPNLGDKGFSGEVFDGRGARQALSGAMDAAAARKALVLAAREYAAQLT